MQSSAQINFAPPFPAIVQPNRLLGRLVVNPHRLTAAATTAQLNPSPTRVDIQAQVQQSSYMTPTGLQADRHVFAPGPARVWNAMLANRRSVLAILDVFARNHQAWLITAVSTVNGAIVAINYERVRFVNSRFVIELNDPCECWLACGST